MKASDIDALHALLTCSKARDDLELARDAMDDAGIALLALRDERDRLSGDLDSAIALYGAVKAERDALQARVGELERTCKEFSDDECDYGRELLEKGTRIIALEDERDGLRARLAGVDAGTHRIVKIEVGDLGEK